MSDPSQPPTFVQSIGEHLVFRRRRGEPAPLILSDVDHLGPPVTKPIGSETAVSAQSLSKLYRAPRGVGRRGAAPLPEQRANDETPRSVWAVRELTFDVSRGAALGIIGANGSGKTALLKLLARITPPTSGRVIIRGRVAPVLELATSLMQGEATGRQNVHLLARFFGVPREIAERRMEDIVAFGELERVIDLEAKRYSSGQSRRLAFSAVLNLEPDVLLADEVLSVGDSAFRERCLVRVEDGLRAGVTLLFASHDLELVRRLCHDAIWLENGRVVQQGPAEELTREYERRTLGAKHAAQPDTPAAAVRKASFTEEAALLEGGVFSNDGFPVESVRSDEEGLLEMTLEVSRPHVQIRAVFVLGLRRYHLIRFLQPEPFSFDRAGTYTLSVHLPAGLLPDGHYAVRLGAWVKRGLEELPIVKPDAFSFEIVASPLREELDDEVLLDDEIDDDDADAGRLRLDDDHERKIIEVTDLAWAVRRNVKAPR